MSAAQAVISRQSVGKSTSGHDGDWLADLAGVWVERWLAHGGYLIVDANCDRVSLGMRMHSGLWRSKNPWGQRLWHDGWKVGRWRELNEMAEYVPGLYGAIVHHVTLHGVLCEGGSRMMTRSAEEMGVV